MTFESLGKALVAHAKKATTALAKEHGDLVVSAFAFDADPYNESFACCFDDGAGDSVGLFSHHLFHEFELAVHAQLPKGGAPPWKGKDGYIEHHMRPVLVDACKLIASKGLLAKLQGAPSIRIGYAYPGEALRVVTTVQGTPAKATKPGATRLSSSPRAEPLSDEERRALLASPDAFDRLAFVFEPERMKDDVLWSDAFETMLSLAGTPAKIDDPWVDRAISLLDVDSVRNGAIFVLGASGQPRARAALHAAAGKESNGKAAVELALRGDPRASAFIGPMLFDKKWRKDVGWLLKALGSCRDLEAVGVIEKWIASRRNKADPDIRFALKAIANLKGKPASS